jgi:hypothetical protein
MFNILQHIEYASVHRDDSDDEDELEDELPEGWEDEMGQLKFPNEVKDVEDEDDNSWEHFDACDFEDEEDLGDFETTDMTFGVCAHWFAVFPSVYTMTFSR